MMHRFGGYIQTAPPGSRYGSIWRFRISDAKWTSVHTTAHTHTHADALNGASMLSHTVTPICALISDCCSCTVLCVCCVLPAVCCMRAAGGVGPVLRIRLP